MNILNINPLGLQLIVGVLIGIGAGFLGSFMVLKRMSLVGDALSHVALPGIAIAMMLSFNPFFGAFGTLFIGIIGIWFLERKTALPSETLVGILFTLSLAIGILITPEPELLEALFGDINKIGSTDLFLTAGAVLITIILMQKIYKGVILDIISRDLTRSMGISVNTTNLIFLILVAVVVALGLKVAGTLLMGSLVIIPAAAAKNISINLKDYTLYAGIFGALCAASGILIAYYFSLPPGPMVVLASGALFLVTLLLKEKK
ncbi:MAG: metal ABC transporter permease [Patescibacteria group bacterium]